jgi:hypothetical protein
MAITDSLRVAIEALHQAIRDEPQAEDKAKLAQCLTQIMQVQAKNLAEGDYGPAGRRWWWWGGRQPWACARARRATFRRNGGRRPVSSYEHPELMVDEHGNVVVNPSYQAPPDATDRAMMQQAALRAAVLAGLTNGNMGANITGTLGAGQFPTVPVHQPTHAHGITSHHIRAALLAALHHAASGGGPFRLAEPPNPFRRAPQPTPSNPYRRVPAAAPLWRSV